MRALIIEGITASGKSTILAEVNRKLAELHPQISKTFLSEHYTQRVLEKLRDEQKLGTRHIRQHLEQITDSLLAYELMYQKSGFASKGKNERTMICLLERFILTHLLQYSQYYKFADAIAVLKKLQPLQMKQVVLLIPEDEFADRIMSTRKYRNHNWSKYLDTIGTEDEILVHFRKQQELLLKYSAKMGRYIDTEILEVGKNDIAEIIDQILALLG